MKKTKEYFHFGKKIIILFICAIFLVHFISSLKLIGFFLIVGGLIFVYFYIIYGIFKHKKSIKKEEIKKLIPYYLALPFFIGLDTFSTYFFVFNEGIENEANILIRVLYETIGSYALLITFIILLTLIILFSLFTLGKKGVIESKNIIKIFYALFVAVFIFNIVI